MCSVANKVFMFGFCTERPWKWSNWIINTKIVDYAGGAKNISSILTADCPSRKRPAYYSFELYTSVFFMFFKNG